VSVILYQGIIHIFDMCDIVNTKTQKSERRQIKSQECFKFANIIVLHVDFRVFLGKIIIIIDDFWHSETVLLNLDGLMLRSKCLKSHDSCSYCS
jgi:hypothetical protein